MKKLPNQVTEALDLYRRNLAATDPKAPVVILCDLSGSMSFPVERDADGRGRSRFSYLQEALRQVLRHCPQAKVVGFNSGTWTVSTADELPGPSSGTWMVQAFKHVAKMHPRRTILISDGEPTDPEQEVFAAAREVSGTIEVIYCGPPDDKTAQRFLSELARKGAGTMHVRQLGAPGQESLGETIKGLLPG